MRPTMKPSSVGLKRALRVVGLIILKLHVGPGKALFTQLLRAAGC